MSTVLIVVGAVVLLVVLSIALMYNSLVRSRNLVATSWHAIDVELQRRHDLVPNLVETVKGYAAHEQSVFARITEARAAAMGAAPTADARRATETELVGALRQVMALAEAYPQLKANEQFLSLQRQLADTEDRIAVTRRIYNANVRSYNNRVQSVPTNVVAGFGHFTEAPYFEVEESLRSAPPPSVGSFGSAQP